MKPQGGQGVTTRACLRSPCPRASSLRMVMLVAMTSIPVGHYTLFKLKPNGFLQRAK